MRSSVLVIDQGTTGTGVHLVSEQGQLLVTVDHEFPQIYPQPGWVEHNGDQIWTTVLQGIAEVSRWAQQHQYQIACVGITNQRETTLAWDEHGQLLHNAIVWQCRRTTERCQALKKMGWANKIKSKTGLVLDPYFSATKMEWLLKNVSAVKDRARKGRLHFGTMDTFLAYRLTQGQSFVTDVSNASRTMLMNLKTGQWADELLKLFGVSSAMLPTIHPSGRVFGKVQGIPGLVDGTPITGILGDQQSALFGQLALKVGEGKVTFGTGSFILLNTGSERIHSKQGLLSTVAWQLPNSKKRVYALEGGAFICGAAIQWLRDNLKLITKAADIETLAQSVPSAEGVQFVPALTGLGAPYWDPEARGAFFGLTRGTQGGHLARAALEAMALQNVDILAAMQKELGKKIINLKVDGGAAQNNLLMQLQSDYMGVKVARPQQIETTALGVAYMAGLAAGIWQNTEQLKRLWLTDQIFQPQLSLNRRNQRLQSWHHVIKAVRNVK